MRLISSVQYLWGDKLRLLDREGNVDDTQRRNLISRLTKPLSEEEGRRYTAPALETVEPTASGGDAARRALLNEQPDVPDRLTVLFGPGGIGKTFFLRRVSGRLAVAARQDPCAGIPVFAALPLLLHVHALETWLAGQGLRLPIDALRTLVSEGIIVPILDALDELVRGQAREGSREFLSQLLKTLQARGRGVLSSRDYYLHHDRLLRDELDTADVPYLTVGFFTQPGRRRYIQQRTGLSADQASRWARSLQEQAESALQGAAPGEVEALIGHPLFLEGFCELILRLPLDQRAVAASEFRLTSPDVFGEIVDRVLMREHEQKALPGWRQKGLGERLVGPWTDPFEPELQKRVLRHLTLLVARDGAAETIRRESSDDRYHPLRHGLFTFTSSIALLEDEDPRAVFERLLETILGAPETVPTLTDPEAEQVSATALEETTAFYLQHTLADTRSDHPPDLVFATRHRAYFDYLLAEELIDQMAAALGGTDGSLDFIQWCLDHHMFEHGDEDEGPPFAGCLDFVLWHRSALEQALAAMWSFLSPGGAVAIDKVVIAYLCSLALALLLRRGHWYGGTSLQGLDLTGHDNREIELVPDIVPVISELTIVQCSFPKLVLRNCDLSRVTVTESDFDALITGSTRWSEVSIEAEVEEVHFGPDTELVGCTLDLTGQGADNPEVDATGGVVILRDCELSESLFRGLEAVSATLQFALRIIGCRVIPWPEAAEPHSPGRRFVNRLMTLARRHGHDEYAVFSSKLRGLSLASPGSFPVAIKVLQDYGAVLSNDSMVYLTEAARQHRYSGKSIAGLPNYADVANYWDPIIQGLDEVL